MLAIIVSTFILVDRCLVIDGELSVRVDADADISDVSVDLTSLVSENFHHNYSTAFNVHQFVPLCNKMPIYHMVLETVMQKDMCPDKSEEKKGLLQRNRNQKDPS